jgi:hypothetical protein
MEKCLKYQWLEQVGGFFFSSSKPDISIACTAWRILFLKQKPIRTCHPCPIRCADPGYFLLHSPMNRVS